METKRRLSKLIILISACACFILTTGLLNAAWAATHYVSPTGSASWASSTSVNTPTNVSTAFSSAQAGDIVYFRGGIYNVPAKNSRDTYHGYYEPANSGTVSSPITFAAYSGERPVFNGTAGGTGDDPDFATIFGTNGMDYITFDGFSFQSDNGTKMARIMIWGTDAVSNQSIGITVKNCILNGGSTVLTSTDNREGIRVEAAGYITLQSNIIYNYRQNGDWHNTSAIKMYHDNNITVENNEIYNCSAGLYYKSDVITAMTRYNYIHDCYLGIFTDAWSSGYNMNSHIYHDNVISKISYIGIQLYAEDGGTLNNLSVYNNTVYSPNTSGDNYAIFIGANSSYSASNSQTVYNNIILGAVYKLTFASGTIAECQYNQYGNTGTFNVRTNYGGGSRSYSSLSAWHSSTEVSGGNHPEGSSTLNGLASDPKFVNGSGNYSLLSDFNLQSGSPCKGAGKGGVDVGANISLVGVTGSSKKPASPGPLR